jgi:hypothetical protein
MPAGVTKIAAAANLTEVIRRRSRSAGAHGRVRVKYS